MTSIMASSSSYLPFNPDDPVWADISPLYQQEASSPLCPILYKHEYSKAMDLYRSLVNSTCELSPRSLALTEHLIKLNPSNYSIWQYRAKILLDGEWGNQNDRETRLRNELEFLEQLAHDNMKVYQVWQQRRLIVSALGDPSRELSFISENLARDAKNYHTWAYRQWILAHFGGLTTASSSTTATAATTTTTTTTTAATTAPTGTGAGSFPQLWDLELEYTEQLLGQDVRNNSAWNHRWFCIFGRAGPKPIASSSPSYQDQLEEWTNEWTFKAAKEIAFTKSQISLAPNNPSAWNYLRGIHLAAPVSTPLSKSLGFAKSLISTDLEAKRDPTVDQQGRSPTAAIEWCFDCIEEQCKSIAIQQPNTNMNEKEQLLEQAEQLVKRLYNSDPIRKRFWSFRLQTVRNLFVVDDVLPK